MSSTARDMVMDMLASDEDPEQVPRGTRQPAADQNASRGTRRRMEQPPELVARSGGTYAFTVSHTLPREAVFQPVVSLYDEAVKLGIQQYLDAYEKQYRLAATHDNLKQMKEKGQVPASCRVHRLTVRFESATPELQAELEAKAKELEVFYLDKLISTAEADVTAASTAAAAAATQAKQLVTDVLTKLPAEFQPLKEIKQLGKDAQLRLAWKLHLAKAKLEQLLTKQEEQKQKKAAAAAAAGAQAGAINLDAQVEQLVVKTLEKRLPQLQAQQQQQPPQQQSTKRTKKDKKKKPAPPASPANQQPPNQQQQDFRRGRQRR